MHRVIVVTSSFFSGLVGVSLPSSSTPASQIVKPGPSTVSAESHGKSQELHSPGSSSSKQKERVVGRLRFINYSYMDCSRNQAS